MKKNQDSKEDVLKDLIAIQKYEYQGMDHVDAIRLFGISKKEYCALYNKYKKEIVDNHYYHLNNFLFKLQKIFKKKVIISIHPKYNLNFIQRKFKKFKVVKYKTRKLIQNSFIVTDFGSSSVIDAIISNKNIISLISPYNDYPNNVYSKVLKLCEYDITNYKDLTRKNLLSNFKKNKRSYSGFIKSKHYLGKKIYGYKVIISEMNKLFNLI